MTRVLIITTIGDSARAKQQASLTAFQAAVQRATTQVAVDFCGVQELIFRVTEAGCGISLRGKELADHYDVVFLRNVDKFIDYASAIRLYCQSKGIRLLNDADATLPYYGKVSQGFLFVLNGVPTPALVSSPDNQTLLEQLITDNPVYPFILKHNDGIKGRYNYLVASVAELRSYLGQARNGFVMQPFIANDGELRLLTFGNQPALIFKKYAASGTHLNNVAQGGRIEQLQPEEVDAPILAAASQVTKLTGRELGGVDVLLATDGTWYILEVNHTPALASGTLLPEKQVAFISYIESLR